MTLGLSLIVRNAASTIRRALESFTGVVDEIVAVDTGSTDETVAILEEFRARVVHRPWDDDFAAARNRALEESRTTWFFSLDADEWVRPGDAARIRACAESGSAGAYVLETINFRRDRDESCMETDGEDAAVAPFYLLTSKVRLARSHLRWEGRVHELLDYSARRAGLEVARCDVPVLHDGFLRKSSGDYYLRLCRDAYAAGEAHPGIVATLGMEALARGKAEEAEKFLREAIRMDDGFDYPLIWLAKILQRTGRDEEAIGILMPAMKRCPHSAGILAALIEIFRDRGESKSVRVLSELGEKLFPGNPYLRKAKESLPRTSN